MGVKSAFWDGKRVLLTGHTGFKGGWLAIWLRELGAEIVGIALPPPTGPSLFEIANVSLDVRSNLCDIMDVEEVKAIFHDFQPEIVFHLAAQSLVRHSYTNPLETYQTNVIGTLHVLEAIRSSQSVRSAVMVTSDKCYLNNEQGRSYQESDPMGGFDPYSSSKACAELLISSYRFSYFSQLPSDKHVAVASARAGNVIGGGDWANDRLVPDIIRALTSGQTVHIRNPESIRPWQHVLEPLSGYLMLAERLYDTGEDFAEGWNFGPDLEDAKPVSWIVCKLIEQWGNGADWEFDGRDHPHEAKQLNLDCRKANSVLGWKAKWSLETAVEKIVDWHKAEQRGENMRELCRAQIESYMNS